MPPTNLLQFLSPNSRLPTDVIFEVYPSSTSSTPVKVEAHKCFLANANTVFDKMFFQSGQAREPHEVTVQIKNKSEDVFRMFLNHLYGDEVVVEDLSSLSSVIQMFELVEQYDVVELKESLLQKMKTQVVEKDNFLSVVDFVKVKVCSGPSEVKKILEGMLAKYLQVNLGESLTKLAKFMSVHEVDNHTLAYLLELSSKSGGEDEKFDSVSLVPSDRKRDVIVEFLEFSKFPKDQIEKMVNLFTEGIKIDD